VLGRQIREGCLLSPQDKGIRAVEVKPVFERNRTGGLYSYDVEGIRRS